MNKEKIGRIIVEILKIIVTIAVTDPYRKAGSTRRSTR